MLTLSVLRLEDKLIRALLGLFSLFSHYYNYSRRSDFDIFSLWKPVHASAFPPAVLNFLLFPATLFAKTAYTCTSKGQSYHLFTSLCHHYPVTLSIYHLATLQLLFGPALTSHFHFTSLDDSNIFFPQSDYSQLFLPFCTASWRFYTPFRLP